MLGEFPSASSNALIPLALLEAACRPAIDHGAPIVIGVDPAGPGKDRTAAVACAAGAILSTGIYTDADARGPVIQFVRRFADRLKIVRVDSTSIGFYFSEHIRSSGYRTEGINIATRPMIRNGLRTSRHSGCWFLRERFQKGQVSGLSDEMLADLAAITYTVDPHGRIAMDGKADVKSALGRSPTWPKRS